MSKIEDCGHEGKLLPEPDERRILRQAAGIPAYRFAIQIGVSPASIYAWEAGTQNPTGLQLDAYQKALRRLAARHGGQVGITWPHDS